MTEDATVELMDDILTEAHRLFIQFGLDNWRFEFDQRKRFMGRCRHKAKLITFSVYFLHAPREEITDTLLHEIAHALVGPGHKHDDIWRAKAAEIGARPETCGTVSTSAGYNYLICCPTCGWELRRIRMRSRNFGATCKTCKTEVEIYERSNGGYSLISG